MRKIVTKVYKIDELSDTTRDKAIEMLSHEYYCVESDANWMEASESRQRAEEITGVNAALESNSQGWYCRYYSVDYSSSLLQTNDKIGILLWNKVIAEIQKMKVELWSDDEIIKAFLSHEYDNNRSYEDNVVDVYLKFAKQIDDINIDLLSDEEGIIDYAEANDMEFLANGNPYHLKG